MCCWLTFQHKNKTIVTQENNRNQCVIGKTRKNQEKLDFRKKNNRNQCVFDKWYKKSKKRDCHAKNNDSNQYGVCINVWEFKQN